MYTLIYFRIFFLIVANALHEVKVKHSNIP